MVKNSPRSVESSSPKADVFADAKSVVPPCHEVTPTLGVLVGVDEEAHGSDAICLVARMRFPDVHATLVHIGEPILNPAIMSPDCYYADPTPRLEDLESKAKALLETAKSLTISTGLDKDPNTIYWPTSVPGAIDEGGRLIELSKDQPIDLIVIGSENKDRWARFFGGSVGETLAARFDRSFLIARGGVAAEGVVNAVFATDLSEYADCCLDLLLQMGPAGLKRIDLVTASDRQEDFEPVDDEDWGAAVNPGNAMRRRGQELVRRIESKGYAASHQLVLGDTHDVVEKAIGSAKADLLILGARGHGFLDRTFLGSVSFREVTDSPYSVLVLRTRAD